MTMTEKVARTMNHESYQFRGSVSIEFDQLRSSPETTLRYGAIGSAPSTRTLGDLTWEGCLVRRIWKWLVLGLVVIVALGVAGWYFFLKTDPEPRAAIKETPTVATSAGSSGPDGTWAVKPGNTNNFVGYRVTEKLFANISDTEATGRTDNVTASMTIDGTTVSDVTITADLRDLKSDNNFRDDRIHSEGLESDRFPEAKFVLTAPITLGAAPAIGTTIPAEATGDFTLHGVTKHVTVPLQGRWDGKQVQVVGNLPIAFSDYGITAPTAPAVASVDDHGEMEFQLFFAQA
jgi:polyisoprenoid-binding protein YceI